MNVIISSDNKIFKQCRELTQKKFRDRSGKYLIEGPNLIEEALKNFAVMDFVVVRSDFDMADKLETELSDTKIFYMDSGLFDKLAQTETSQGILAVVSKKYYDEAEFFGAVNAGNLLVLDRLQDPGNIGTIIRTADAAGFGGIVIMKGSGDVFSPKVVRAAAGSVFRMPILFSKDYSEVYRLLENHGKTLAATCFDTENMYYDVDLSKNTAIIIGNEGNGISKEFAEMAELKIKIPMQGNIESLNAGIAAAVLMYESVRQANKKSC